MPSARSWAFEGSISESQLVQTGEIGTPQLRLVSGETSYILGRVTNQSVLVFPYLAWRWKVQAPWSPRAKIQKTHTHPIKVFVGLNLNQRLNLSSSPHPSVGIPNKIPSYDRGLFFVWGKSEEMMGKLTYQGRKYSKHAAYTVRGGNKKEGQWWSEIIDIAALYKKAWPNEEYRDASVIFVGIAAAESDYPATTYIDSLRLSH